MALTKAVDEKFHRPLKKFFQKTLDKQLLICYNIGTKAKGFDFMTINFSELSTQEIREIVASGQHSLNERTNLAIIQKAQAIVKLIDEIYDLVADEGGDPDIEILDSYSSLLDVRDSFANLSWKNFQRRD